MKALLLSIGILWIAAGVGRALLQRMVVLRRLSAERFVFGAALGLGAAAYGVFALGLCGLLSFWPITVWWCLLALFGARGMVANAADAVQAVRGVRTPGGREHRTVVGIGAFVILLACAAVTILCCFLPPTGHAWDVLAYHLADARIFLAQHRIAVLPTEHHSNFPLTMEMLFAVGLLYDGYALANLLHFLTAALTVAAMLGFCRRLFSPIAGYIAAVVFATTPLVLGEAGIAYIDLGLGLFTTLSAFAAVSAIEERAQPDVPGAKAASQPFSLEWVMLAGAAMGFALGIKYLALLPFVLIGALLLLRRIPLRHIAVYAGIAAAIGSPWYIKNAVLMHNPVYPYLYSLFPGSRYWSRDRAMNYQGEQTSFGYPHSLTSPGETLINLIEVPWHVVSHPEKYANQGDYTTTSWIGGLYGGLCLAVAFVRRPARAVTDLLLLGLLQVIAWFFIAQVGRYLVSALPPLAVTAGYAAWRLTERAPAGAREAAGNLLLRLLIGAAVIGQAALLLWSVFALPTSEMMAMQAGVMPTSVSVPEAIDVLSQPDGAERELHRHLDIYNAISWINRNTRPGDGVILYDEVRGFYLDRPYLWGNGEHSSYIPYASMRNGRDLTDWLLRHGYRYALFNMNHRLKPPPQTGAVGTEQAAFQELFTELRQAPDAVFQQLYVEKPEAPGTWRAKVQDALRHGLWTPIPFSEWTHLPQNGVTVLRIGPAVSASTYRAHGVRPS